MGGDLGGSFSATRLRADGPRAPLLVRFLDLAVPGGDFAANLSSRTLAQVVNLLGPIDRCRGSLHSRLELKSQVQGVVPRLVQVAAVKPERLLLGGLPHVAQLT